MVPYLNKKGYKMKRILLAVVILVGISGGAHSETALTQLLGGTDAKTISVPANPRPEKITRNGKDSQSHINAASFAELPKNSCKANVFREWIDIIPTEGQQYLRTKTEQFVARGCDVLRQSAVSCASNDTDTAVNIIYTGCSASNEQGTLDAILYRAVFDNNVPADLHLKQKLAKLESAGCKIWEQRIIGGWRRTVHIIYYGCVSQDVDTANCSASDVYETDYD